MRYWLAVAPIWPAACRVGCMPPPLHPGKVPLSEMSDVNENPQQPTDGQPRRTIRSFVMRAGRMTEGQQRGVEKGWPLFGLRDRKSTRLNSSHVRISYAVFCLK